MNIENMLKKLDELSKGKIPLITPHMLKKILLAGEVPTITKINSTLSYRTKSTTPNITGGK